MMLALRNKQMLAIFVLIALSLIILALMVMSIAHINVWQALNIKPDAFVPWY